MLRNNVLNASRPGVAVAPFALVLCAGVALAQPVLIDTDTTIGPLDTTVTGMAGVPVPLATAEITVSGSGTDLTINGRHTIASLVINANSTVRHDAAFTFDYAGDGSDVVNGVDLTVTGDAEIVTGGTMNATGSGFPADEGPGAGVLDPNWAGGGAYGGEGGFSATGAPGGEPYGSIFTPNQFGSGGGTDVGANALGRPGGGAIRLVVGGTLHFDGLIVANGLSRSTGEEGGGAGGSVWVEAGAITGTTGAIQANGGSGNGSVSGAGSGGRIAVYSGSPLPGLLAERVTTVGGDGWSSNIFGGDGAAGTVYIEEAGSGTLIIDNKGRDGRITPLSDPDIMPAFFDGDVIVRNRGRMGPSIGVPLDLEITGDVTVESDGIIEADGRGFGADQGPGAGILDPDWAGGGAYGGEGGLSAAGAPGGEPYGSVFQPTDLGSGGGTDVGADRPGGAGGGAIKLVIGGTLDILGVIEANGLSRSTDEEGGGSGGSIWIDAGSITGTTGVIRANGGGGNTNVSGAGSGGRVAVYSGSTLPPFFSERINAFGGNGWASGITFGDGSAGTVYIEEAGAARLIIDNNGLDGRITPITDPSIFPSVFTGDIVVRDRGKLGPAAGVPLDLQITGNVIVHNGGFITADGRGFGSDSGPGAGSISPSDASGGGYGGEGGEGSARQPGGMPYGSVTEPADLGSGGGTDVSTQVPGAPGGGAIRLVVSGTLDLEGVIEADGFSGGDDAGGGSGGSVWINADTITGTSGVIRANGGNGDGNRASGAGSGGRIAVYANNPLPLFLDDRINAVGGDGWSSGFVGGDGGAGTVYLDVAGERTLIIDNNGRDGRVTPLSDPAMFPRMFDGDVIVRDNGRLAPAAGEPLEMHITGDLTIGTNGRLYASGRGFPSDFGPGAGAAVAGDASGGGHGGQGGFGSARSPAGEPYGSVKQPITLGSGGGTDVSRLTLGGAGGGAIRLTVDGMLDLGGLIEADGINGGDDSGGGSGGSVWIDAHAISGSTGLIRANGGRGDPNFVSGAGSGGRIAVYVDTGFPPGFADRITTFGGDGWSSGINGGDGAAGTVYLEEAGTATLIIDNNGRDGRVTTFGSSNLDVLLDGGVFVDGDMIVREGGKAGPERGEFTAFFIRDDVSIDGTGRFTASGLGFGSDEGPGAGMRGLSWGGGGAHAGDGGNGRSDDPDALGGSAYGEPEFPMTLGSGGANDPNTEAVGGLGGGAFRLSVGGTLTMNGPIEADGFGGSANEAGAGAGGSVWVEASAISGVNFIRANGGPGASAGGGGGGGYVAVYSCNVAPTVILQANGGGSGSGSGGQAGVTTLGSGSIIITDEPPTLVTVPSGQPLSLSVGVMADGVPTFQWRRDGVDLVDDARISGANTADLVIMSALEADAGEYDVLVTDSCGSRRSMGTTVAVGPPGACNPADIAPAFGILDLADVDLFISGFLSNDSAADLATPIGVFDLADIDVFITGFLSGCP